MIPRKYHSLEKSNFNFSETIVLNLARGNEKPDVFLACERKLNLIDFYNNNPLTKSKTLFVMKERKLFERKL